MFTINKKYLIVFEIKDSIITFTCLIVNEDENFIYFIDKFGKTLSYNKKYIVSWEEIK